MSQTLLDQIKEKCSIPDFHPHSIKNNRSNCATHKNSSSPSFVYYSNTDTFFCHSCFSDHHMPLGSDVVGYFAHVYGYSDRTEAKLDLAKQLGITLTQKSKVEIEFEMFKLDIFQFFMQKCEENLLKHKDLYDMLQTKREFTNETMSCYHFGLFDANIQALMEDTYTTHELQLSGFLNEKSGWNCGKRLVFPYFNERNEPTYFIYRRFDNEPDFNPNAKYVKHFTKSPSLIKNQIFGRESLVQYRNKPLILSEGILDCVSTIQCEYPSLSPVTTQFSKNDVESVLDYAKRYDKIVVINDSEENEQGLKGAISTVKLFLQADIPIFIGIIPRQDVKKIDLDDYLRGDNAKDKLDELVNNSVDGLEYLVQNISHFDQTEREDELKDLIKLFIRIEESDLAIKLHTDEDQLNRIKELVKAYKSKEQFKLGIKLSDYDAFRKEVEKKQKQDLNKQRSRAIEQRKKRMLQIKQDLAKNEDFYWDDQILHESRFNIKWWGSEDKPIWERDEDGRLLGWDNYRKISTKEAETLGITPRPNEKMSKSQYVAMKLEEERLERDGVAPFLFVVYEGTYYKYDGRFWKSAKIEELEDQIGKIHSQLFKGELPDIAMTKAIIHKYKQRHMIKKHEPFSEVSKIKGKLPLKNGVLELDLAKIYDLNCRIEKGSDLVKNFHEYTARDFFTGGLNTIYDEEAVATELDEKLNEWLADNDQANTKRWRDRLLGFTADCLLPGNEMNWIQFLLGSGRNGKGTWAKVLAHLFGSDLVSELKWQSFDPRYDKYGTSPLEGKWLNIGSECNHEQKIDLSIVKSISGEDKIPLRKMQKDPYDYLVMAKLLFLDNIVPKFPKSETAFWGRINTVPFNHTWEGKEDPTLKERLQKEAEKGGLLNLLLPYLLLSERKRIKLEAQSDSHEIVQDFSEKNLDIYRFFEDSIESTDIVNDNISTEEAWLLYKHWYFLNRGDYPKECNKKKPTQSIGTSLTYWIKGQVKSGVIPQSRIKSDQRVGNLRLKPYFRFNEIFLGDLQYQIVNKLLQKQIEFKDYKELLEIHPVLNDYVIPLDMQNKINRNRIRKNSLDSEDPYYRTKQIEAYKKDHPLTDEIKAVLDGWMELGVSSDLDQLTAKKDLITELRNIREVIPRENLIAGIKSKDIQNPIEFIEQLTNTYHLIEPCDEAHSCYAVIH
ncbi:phage/plasmid primase, P4 family [Candidatus Lokiarchaeum ossiferum]|uniref:phage/plasmid primase, P4 family n=1 Tax=Candidatus Lokiarchaeum ossiferum TaxID=2951803 RepID=UPI00352CB192